MTLKERLEHRYGYLRFIDNWHKHPIVGRMMCRMGRHDFELHKIQDNGAVLECFYCGRQRYSQPFVDRMPIEG